MIKSSFTLVSLYAITALAQYAPPAGWVGSTAISKDSSVIVNWGYNIENFDPGLQDISTSTGLLASFGVPANALGPAEGNSADVVSLGDGGSITIGMQYPVKNGSGPDFAVFENSVWDDFLELAFVEVSTDGHHFVRFPGVSLTQDTVQIGTFGYLDPTLIHNLAGKYRQGYGTPFDLEDISDSTGINLDSINYIRINDVVGNIDPLYATYDHLGNKINDPFPTPFESCGFDLDAIAVIHENNILASVNSENWLVKIFPNPVSDFINIQTKMTNYTVKLYEINGKEVLKHHAADKINLSDIPDGMYILKLETLDSYLIRKIVISHQ